MEKHACMDTEESGVSAMVKTVTETKHLRQEHATAQFFEDLSTFQTYTHSYARL